MSTLGVDLAASALTDQEQGEALVKHYDLVMDAVIGLWRTATEPRRKEIRQFLEDLREWHGHDQEDEHCDPECPAWFPGAYCGSCGEQHLILTDPDEVEFG